MERQVTVRAPEGLHARPAAELVAAAAHYQSRVEVVVGDQIGNARSIISLLKLGVKSGQQVVLRATGADEERALEALAAILERA